MARSNNTISFEPCTLVYTLIDPEFIPFDDFSLIIRSLHTYMVESVTPNPSMNNVHVKLNYQASIANAQKKLGGLTQAVGITKLSNHVKESEFSRLELLKQQYGINHGSDEPLPYAAPRGRGRGRIFPSRPPVYPPAPYGKPSRVRKTKAAYTDAQRFTPPNEFEEACSINESFEHNNEDGESQYQ